MTQPDLIDILVEDHREVQALFAELEAGGGTPERRRDLADACIAELVRHSVAEEQYLYPLARTVLADGDVLTEHEIAEHAEAELTMKDLESLPATDPAFDQLVTRLIEQIRHHLQEEEGDLFPRLREVCKPDLLREEGEKVQRAKKFAPTRPHPGAPDHPPWNKVFGPGLGLVDRVRDAVSGRETSPHHVKPDID